MVPQRGVLTSATDYYIINPVGGGRVGAMLGGRTDTVPKSGVATRPQGEGGAAQMSGINLAGVGY